MYLELPQGWFRVGLFTIYIRVLNPRNLAWFTPLLCIVVSSMEEMAVLSFLRESENAVHLYYVVLLRLYNEGCFRQITISCFIPISLLHLAGTFHGQKSATRMIASVLKEDPKIKGWLKCCFTSTETVGLLGTGAQDVHLDFHTAPELWHIKGSEERYLLGQNTTCGFSVNTMDKLQWCALNWTVWTIRERHTINVLLIWYSFTFHLGDRK